MATWTGQAHAQHAAPHSAVPALSRSYTPQYDIIARGYARRRRKEAEHEASLAAAAAAAAAAALASDDVLRLQMELDAMLAQQKAKGDVTLEPGGALVITLLPLITAGLGPLVMMGWSGAASETYGMLVQKHAEGNAAFEPGGAPVVMLLPSGVCRLGVLEWGRVASQTGSVVTQQQAEGDMA